MGSNAVLGKGRASQLLQRSSAGGEDEINVPIALSEHSHSEGRPVCAPTPVHVQVQVQCIGSDDCACDLSMTPPCRQPHSVFGGLYLPIYLSISLSIYLSVHPSVCQSIYLSVCLSPDSHTNPPILQIQPKGKPVP